MREGYGPTFSMVLRRGEQRVEITCGPITDDVLASHRRGHGGLIVDARVAELYPEVVERFRSQLFDEAAETLVLPRGEAAKDVELLPTLWTRMGAGGFQRSSMLVVLGGGATLDVGAFLGATWQRGIDVLLVPTTLLAQVDAGLGGKCGVNMGDVKNQVGAIYQPKALLVDPAFLASLEYDEWLSGLGEVLKTALLAGGTLWTELCLFDGAARKKLEDPAVSRLVRACLKYKANLVEQDERERGVRTLLNLGHTVGHVLEALSLRHGAAVVPHGCAVAAGILAEARAFGAPSSVVAAIKDRMVALGLPTEISLPFDREEVLQLLLADKKRAGRGISVPFLREMGDADLRVESPESLVDAVRLAIEAP